MTDWGALIRKLEQRWDKSQAEVLEQLLVIVRYAIQTPLSSVGTSSSLLKDHAKSPQVRIWAKKCHQMYQEWGHAYGELHKRCISSSENAEMASQCIIQGIGPQLAGSVDLLEESAQILELTEGDMARIAKILQHHLSTIATIHREARAHDLSWVLAYLDEERKLRGE